MKTKCSICGCEITESPMTCTRCNVNYHHDCWDYNGGCAIYGCSEANRASKVVSLPAEDKLVVLPEKAPDSQFKESKFWLCNTLTFGVVFLSPVGLIFFNRWSRFGYRMSHPATMNGSMVLLFLSMVLSWYFYRSANWYSSFSSVTVRIFVSCFVLADAPILWFLFVFLSALITCFTYHREDSLPALAR